MKEYFFRCETAVSFAGPASRHSWLMRCVPRSSQMQRVLGSTFSVFVTDAGGNEAPAPWIAGTDGFGNDVRHGFAAGPHILLRFVSEGTLLQDGCRLCGTAHGMYLQQTRLTRPSEEMLLFLARLGLGGRNEAGAEHAAALVAAAVRSRMTYVPGSTNAGTTAAEAFARSSGVCQDYAHITCGLLRACGVPARYVCGLVPGEGATHAWIEYFSRGAWISMDPTNGIVSGFARFSHGRDGADCALNRGTFYGGSGQQVAVTAVLREMSGAGRAERPARMQPHDGIASRPIPAKDSE